MVKIMDDERNSQRSVARITNRSRLFGTPRYNERVILMLILSKQGARMCAGLK
jgi:hypothetical protein